MVSSTFPILSTRFMDLDLTRGLTATCAPLATFSHMQGIAAKNNFLELPLVPLKFLIQQSLAMLFPSQVFPMITSSQITSVISYVFATNNILVYCSTLLHDLQYLCFINLCSQHVSKSRQFSYSLCMINFPSCSFFSFSVVFFAKIFLPAFLKPYFSFTAMSTLSKE